MYYNYKVLRSNSLLHLASMFSFVFKDVIQEYYLLCWHEDEVFARTPVPSAETTEKHNEMSDFNFYRPQPEPVTCINLFVFEKADLQSDSFLFT